MAHPAFEMLAIRARSNGLEVEFTKPLRVGDGTQASDYKVQQWHYYWTHEGESQEKRDLENLPIKSVSLSDDRKKVFLEISGMKKEHVLYVQLQPTFLSNENEQLWSNEGWYTLNEFPNVEGTVNPSQFPTKTNQLTTSEINEGWQMLFDGKSKDGWNSNAQSDWSVSNGALVGNGTDNEGILLTKRSFENFELELQWEVSAGTEGGILFMIPEDLDGRTILPVSPRFQLTDDRTEDAKSVHTHKSGANYDIQAPIYVVTKPLNQYNELRLVMNQGQVEHWINGIKVVDYQLNSERWRELVQTSTYVNEQAYGQAKTGLLGLFVAKGEISFRNIRIREL